MEALDLKRLFGGAYAGRRVLVTGHTGFKGSWLAVWLHALGAEVGGLALLPDTSPSHWSLLELPIAYEAIIDLKDAQAVEESVSRFQPEIVFHLAAQSLVRRSYRDPVSTFSSNITGLVNLLEALRATPSVRVIVNATTDKVYEPQPTDSGYREDFPLGGHDPYSTSKACAELISTCYRRSYFEPQGGHVRLATARAGNVVGGGDWAEDRLIPDMVRNVALGQSIRVRNPLSTRPWQHVLESLSGYLRLGQVLLAGETTGGAWNLGPSPSNVLTVGDVVARIQALWPELRAEFDDGPRPHEASELQLDSTKAERDLQWRPVWDADTTFKRTACWYQHFLRDGSVRTSNDLSTYVDDARQAGLPWAT